VDLLERLPAPGGLVRYGVAPDHLATSAPVAARFLRLAGDSERVRLFSNVSVGDEQTPGGGLLSLAALRRRSHAVVLTTGAQRQRPLSIPGETSLRNVLPASAFVAWATGHPADARLPPPDLSFGADAAVVGLGNVALDVSRLLLREPSSLRAGSDAPSSVVDQLLRSRVTTVTLLARRSGAQCAATPKELRELFSLPGVRVLCDQGESLGNAAEDEEELEGDEGPVRSRRRAVEEMRKAVSRGRPLTSASDGIERTLRLCFLHSPDAFIDHDDNAGVVGALRLRPNALIGPPGHRHVVTAPTSGMLPLLPAQLAVFSTGNIGAPIAGLPFDEKSGTVPNERGAVLCGAGGDTAGLFVAGWLKRGARGVIGTNLGCAEETVETLCQAAESGALPAPDEPPFADAAEVEAASGAAGGSVLTAAGWARVSEEEERRGREGGRPREKMLTADEMVAFAAAGG
jgi:adrenodoxin-NADP+ reductase